MENRTAVLHSSSPTVCTEKVDEVVMRPNKAETAVHGCHCPGDMAVRMRKVLARHVVWCSSVSLALIVVTKIYFAHRSPIKADPPSQRMPWENCRAAPSHQLPHVLRGAGA